MFYPKKLYTFGSIRLYEKIGLLDVFFWLFLLLAAFYVIGKLTGLIGTPEWVELLPIISIIFAAGIVYGKLVSFIEASERRTGYLKKHLDRVEQKQKDKL